MSDLTDVYDIDDELVAAGDWDWGMVRCALGAADSSPHGQILEKARLPDLSGSEGQDDEGDFYDDEDDGDEDDDDFFPDEDDEDFDDDEDEDDTFSDDDLDDL